MQDSHCCDALLQLFNEAERRWAERMERIARQQHSADLLAMPAEALMIPEAWNLKQVSFLLLMIQASQVTSLHHST